MADGPDFIERAESISKNWTGESFSEEQMLQEFHLYGHAKRAQALDQFDAELASPDAADNVNRFVQLSSLRRNMDRVHHALRKAGR